MDSEFLKRCERELKKNESKKGDWKDWNPNTKELAREISWHSSKLCHALMSADVDDVKEFSADVANICEKAFIQAYRAKRNKKRMTDFYGDFVGWDFGEKFQPLKKLRDD